MSAQDVFDLRSAVLSDLHEKTHGTVFVDGPNPYLHFELGEIADPTGRRLIVVDFSNDMSFTHLMLTMGDATAAERGRPALIAGIPAGPCRMLFPVRIAASATWIRIQPQVPMATSFCLAGMALQRVNRLRWEAMHMRGEIARSLQTPLRLPRQALRAAAVFRHSGWRGVKEALRARRLRAYHDANAALGYPAWVKLYDTLGEGDLSAMRGQAAAFAERPLISILMPTFETPERFLRECLDSVLAQTYERWELCIADDASPSPHVRRVLEEYAARDGRIKLAFRAENGHISRATNTAYGLASGTWFALLDHDDLLPPHALFCVVAAMQASPDARLIYSDEDKIGEDGLRFNPYFKPDWNPDLMRSHNLVTHLGVYRRDVLGDDLPFDPAFDGAQDYDLALRYTERAAPGEIVHVPHILYHWRSHVESTAAAGGAKPYAMMRGRDALAAHLQRTEPSGTAELIDHGFRVRYAVPLPEPSVAIVIPTRDAEKITRQCIDSIVAKTTYANWRIVLVDNGSVEQRSFKLFETLKKTGRVAILRDDRPFNYSRLNNLAVRASDCDVVVLLNNDIEVISPDWLTELVGHAMRPGVGAVGARLWYPNQTLQHGGVIVGLGGLAAHAHHALPRGHQGYIGRAALTQTLSAVTGACLAVQRRHYLAVGGLNEDELTIAYNDVDFCLKLMRLGLRTVWTPFAELTHHESMSRGYEDNPEKLIRFEAEKTVMRRDWADVIAHDPAYNPNLTLDNATFDIAFPPRVIKPWRRGP